MWVLAVAKNFGTAARVQETLPERVITEGLRQVPGDSGVIAGCVSVGLRGQAASLFERKLVVLEIYKHGIIVVWVNDNRNAIMIFRGSSNHRGPADVNILDCIVDGCVVARNRLLERIQIDDQQIDRLDSVLGHYCLIDAATAQQPAVNDRVQRFDAAVHDLREVGFLGDLYYVEAGITKLTTGSAGRDYFDVELSKA